MVYVISIKTSGPAFSEDYTNTRAFDSARITSVACLKTDGNNDPSSYWIHDIEQEGQSMPRSVSFEYVLDKLLDTINLESDSIVCHNANFTINCLLSEAYRRSSDSRGGRCVDFVNKFQDYRDKVYCVKKNASEMFNVSHTTSAGLYRIIHPDRELKVDDDLVELVSILYVHNDLMEIENDHFEDMLAKWKNFYNSNMRLPSSVSEDDEERYLGKWCDVVSMNQLNYGHAKQITDTESWPTPIRVRVF